MALLEKLNRLLLPLTEVNKAKHKQIKSLKWLAQEVNKKRNAIAHQGEFCNEGEAKAAIASAKEFIITLVQCMSRNSRLRNVGVNVLWSRRSRTSSLRRLCRMFRCTEQ